MQQIIKENYIINYAPELEDFIIKTVNHAINKKQEFLKLFDCSSKDIGTINASFFVKRNDFVEHIKSISDGQTPPDWATGCFYNNEVQVLVNPDRPEKKFNTLAHETLHIIFDKIIYQKYNIDRVNWLDESFAVYLDGNKNDISKDELKSIIKYLDKICNNFDMKILEDYTKMKTKVYNGYDMFEVIGRYIFENNLEKEFLDLIKSDRNKIIEIGKTILQNAVKHVKNRI